MKQTYVIEHLEPQVWKWCKMEYEHISKIVGKSNLWFTNIKRPNPVLLKCGKVYKQSVRNLDLESVCVLDPDASVTLTPKDAKKFKYFVFGGILGDYPPKKRTRVELTPFLKGATVRNLGKKQMATDNAVYVTHKIANGTPLEKIPFINKATIQINDIESTILPFHYVSIDGKPLISDGVIKYLKNKKGF